MKTIHLRILTLTLGLLFAIPNSAVGPASPQLPDPGTTGMSKEEQEQAGRKVMAEVYKQMPVLPDSSVETQYIQQLGRKLVAVIPPQYSWPYEFHVIPQKEVNAFALPGGPMFVNVGTIVAADSEAQLAGVMAHEMSHVYMQHSAKQAAKAQWTGVIGALGGLFGSGIGGSLARLGTQLGAGTLMLRYSRGDEAQADAVGAIIMHKAGYNPRALAEFFEKLERQTREGGPQFLSDHPNPGNRRQAIDREILNWPARNYSGNSASFLSAKQHAATVTTYSAQQISDTAKQGIWEEQNRRSGAAPRELPADPSPASVPTSLSNVTFEQVQPSRDMTAYRQTDLSVSYPANWRVFGGDQGNATIAPPAGVAQGAAGYGVVIGKVVNQRTGPPEETSASLVQSLQQSNPGLRQSGTAQRTLVGGQQAESVMLVGASPVGFNGQSMEERDWLVAIPRQNGDQLYFLFVAPERDFARLRPTYQQMLDSLELR